MTSFRPRGKWSDPGVPHKGWTCTGIEDLGDLDARCQMCESQEIRYSHRMEHPEFGVLLCGCVCAGKLEENYPAAQDRERLARLETSRRARWLENGWRRFPGEWVKRSKGIQVRIQYKLPDLAWKVYFHDFWAERAAESRRMFSSADDAKVWSWAIQEKLLAKWRKDTL